ncbi:hypothetical protein [Ligilactobacillus equi]|uniref:Uncharacterized protein n=1 Tax=Ligilactobacillus equi DPC 6820 TaxID=1392007 RepID=V7HWH1_9LACO|nr:hypothetical protein [Ligilactobacillus equi]ETA74252.1 hypothetical protein LEQ_2302c [Ligilactobacillus equi DPC 6820]
MSESTSTDEVVRKAELKGVVLQNQIAKILTSEVEVSQVTSTDDISTSMLAPLNVLTGSSAHPTTITLTSDIQTTNQNVNVIVGNASKKNNDASGLVQTGSDSAKGKWIVGTVEKSAKQSSVGEVINNFISSNLIGTYGTMAGMGVLMTLVPLLSMLNRKKR